MNKKLYIGNLPFITTDAELEELFGTHGAIASANVITDRETGRSRGFGFVEFEAESDSQTAQQVLDGYEFGGRALRVSESQERQRSPHRSHNA